MQAHHWNSADESRIEIRPSVHNIVPHNATDSQEHKVVFMHYPSVMVRGAKVEGFVDETWLLATNVPFMNKRMPSLGEYVCAI